MGVFPDVPRVPGSSVLRCAKQSFQDGLGWTNGRAPLGSPWPGSLKVCRFERKAAVPWFNFCAKWFRRTAPLGCRCVSTVIPKSLEQLRDQTLSGTLRDLPRGTHQVSPFAKPDRRCDHAGWQRCPCQENFGNHRIPLRCVSGWHRVRVVAAPCKRPMPFAGLEVGGS